MASDLPREGRGLAPRSIHVICFGNELHGDDGFGPAVHARLAAAPLPGHVRLLRADIAGLVAEAESVRAELASDHDANPALQLAAAIAAGLPDRYARPLSSSPTTSTPSLIAGTPNTNTSARCSGYPPRRHGRCWPWCPTVPCAPPWRAGPMN